MRPRSTWRRSTATPTSSAARASPCTATPRARCRCSRPGPPLGTMYVTITEDDRGQPFEVFISLGKAGGALMADVEAVGRLISLGLRSGIPMREIYRQLRGISSDRAVGLGPNKVLSVPDAIGIAIEKWMQDRQGIQQDLLAEAERGGAGAAGPGAAAPLRGVVAGQGGGGAAALPGGAA